MAKTASAYLFWAFDVVCWTFGDSRSPSRPFPRSPRSGEPPASPTGGAGHRWPPSPRPGSLRHFVLDRHIMLTISEIFSFLRMFSI